MTRPDPDDLRRVVLAATSARRRSHAPYSGFEAGAAVLTADGEVVTGAIVENISLGLAMCAERVAMFTAATRPGGERPDGGGGLRALALAAPDTGPVRTWPCGACRQVALELGGPDLLVAAVGPETPADGATVDWRRLADLLPDGPRRQR